MTKAQVDEILGYDAEHMQKALDHWKANYPKLKVSYANQDRIKDAIKLLQSEGNNEIEIDTSNIPEPPEIDEPPIDSYDEELNDLPF